MYRVMVVEDESIIRKGIVSIIERFDADMQVAWECADAHTAWEIFQAQQPDILITDIVMRGMSGIELVRKIRESGADIPVVILSGHAEFAYAQDAIQLAVCEYVLKPVSVGKFTDALTKLKAKLDEKHRPAHAAGATATLSMEDNNLFIRKFEEYTQNNLNKDLSLKTLSERVHLSPNYLSSLFKEKTGQNYSDYVLGLRMGKAKQLLVNSQLKVYEIAEICGYNNVKHFISSFKKYTGVTPNQYKNK